jgi:hypothetical protein
MIFIFPNEGLVTHDGTTSILKVNALVSGGIHIDVIDPEDQRCGRLSLQPVANGYEICLQSDEGEKSFPFVTWSNEGIRVQDILPRYREVLSTRVYSRLTDSKMSQMQVREFKKLLRKAIAHDANPQPESRKRIEKYNSLYYFFVPGLGPKSMAELARVFLDPYVEETQGGSCNG